MTNSPIGIPSGWEIVASFYWGGCPMASHEDMSFNISSDMSKSNWADYCNDENDWRVEE